jgi:hypothetical protein
MENVKFSALYEPAIHMAALGDRRVYLNVKVMDGCGVTLTAFDFSRSRRQSSPLPTAKFGRPFFQYMCKLFAIAF